MKKSWNTWFGLLYICTVGTSIAFGQKTKHEMREKTKTEFIENKVIKGEIK